MSSPRHPHDARRNTPAEGEGVPKLHAREFTVPPGWYERGKATPNQQPAGYAPGGPLPQNAATAEPEASPQANQGAIERARSAHPPKELRPAEAISTSEPPVVLATELVSSAQYESAPRIDSLPTDRMDAGPTFFDSTQLDGLRTDPDATTPFNAEVRELQALATQPSLRARQRQAAKHRILLFGVLVVLFCASALFVTGLMRKNAPSAQAVATTRPPSVLEARVQAAAKSPAQPSEPPSPAAPAVRPQPQPQPPLSPATAATERLSPRSTARKEPQPEPERTTHPPAPAVRPSAEPARRRPPPSAAPSPNTEPKSKLITRTPTF